MFILVYTKLKTVLGFWFMYSTTPQSSTPLELYAVLLFHPEFHSGLSMVQRLLRSYSF